MDPKVTTEAAAAVLRIFATKCDVVQNVLTSPRTLSRDVFKTAREGRVWGDKTFPDARQADRKNRGTRVPVMSMNKAVHPGFHADCNFKDRNKNANTYIVAYSDFSKAETFIKVYQGTKGAKGKKEDNTLSLFHYVPKHLAGGGSAGTPPLWGWMPLRPEDITDPGDLVSVVGWCTLAMNVPEDDADIAGNPLYAFIMQKVRALLEEGSRRACAKKCRTKAQKRVKTRVVQLNDAEKAVRDAIFAVQTIDAKVAKARNDLSTICLGEDADDDDDDENDEAENDGGGEGVLALKRKCAELERDLAVRDAMLATAKKRRNEYASLKGPLLRSVSDVFSSVSSKRVRHDKTFHTIVVADDE